MPAANQRVTDLFHKMAELLEIHGESPFRARAYRRAAIVISQLPDDVSAYNLTQLDHLPGIGKALAHQIREICETGQLQALAALEASTGPGLLALAALPGLGPKRIRVLQSRLDITDCRGLARAAAAGRLRSLPLFSDRLETALLHAASTAERAAAPPTGG